tara:strand:+ start:1686 stop:3203 length:1518 start_codon:yes stop_codon:yes gene_type:complete
MYENQSLTPIMVLGTSSGSGKSLIATAICRVLSRKGERTIPFKGQNMSNNAWVDIAGGEMAYSQAVQAWSAGLEPSALMNPVLLKPKGDCSSEVIHLGKSVGVSEAKNYYQDWTDSGWEAITNSINRLKQSYEGGRLIVEGAGSPVEINLLHKDITNLKVAKYLDANCLLVADIERGGVFAQIIGTLELLNESEKKLIKGILINRFRGDISLFDEGRHWIEKKTGIPVIGVMPWLNELYPAEDSMDLIERKQKVSRAEIKIGILKLRYISNFSDLDALESERSINLEWIELGELISGIDVLIIPGSKQTIKDLELIKESMTDQHISNYVRRGGDILGICGGMQMLGESLEDPFGLESNKELNNSKMTKGLNYLPIKTFFLEEKITKKSKLSAIWPTRMDIEGYQLRRGKSIAIKGLIENLISMTEESNIGWIYQNNFGGEIIGTYLHGIFDNGAWRRTWLNKIREKKGLTPLSTQIKNHSHMREAILNKLADSFEKHINLDPLIK